MLYNIIVEHLFLSVNIFGKSEKSLDISER